MQNYTEQYQTLEKASEVACYEFLRKVETTPQLKDTSSSREALKCIANCIHLNDKIKVYLEEQDVLGSCQYVLQSEDHISLDTQFLTCRILFFLTVNRPDLVTRLIDASISIAIEKVLTQNICILQDTTNLIDRNMPINPLTVTSEALKLLFNLLLVNSRSTEQENTNIEHFENCLVPIFHLLFQVPYSKPQPLVPPHSQAIHVLMQYPYRIISKVWQSQSDWTSKLYDSAEQSHTFIATTLVHLLDQAVHVLIPDGDPDNLNNSTQVDAILSPVCLVLRSLAEGEPLLSKAIAKKLLPNEK
ncbi:guanine nucleotide exchange factor [Thamnidium elegans]|nr:guanine nucleotide exchange factor [Thamnidium elegans]